MAREGYALQVEAEALPDLQIEDRQRDRYSRAPLHHFAQIAVARIVIIDQLPRKAHLVEQVVVQRQHPLLGKRVPCQALLDRNGDAVELAEILGNIQIRIDVLSEHEARLGEVELVARDDLGEAFEARVHRFSPPASRNRRAGSPAATSRRSKSLRPAARERLSPQPCSNFARSATTAPPPSRTIERAPSPPELRRPSARRFPSRAGARRSHAASACGKASRRSCRRPVRWPARAQRAGRCRSWPLG